MKQTEYMIGMGQLAPPIRRGQLGAANSVTGQFGAGPTRRGRFGAGTFRRGVCNGDIKIMNEQQQQQRPFNGL